MSFYIKIQYIAVILFAAALLSYGIKTERRGFVILGAMVVSLASIIRESSFPSAFALGAGGALWALTNKNASRHIALSFAFAAYLFGLAMVPFVIFYAAKSGYIDRDRNLTSLANIAKQDYGALLLYSLLYIGPAVIAIALAAFTTLRRYFLILFAGVAAVLGEQAIYSVFTPGYMPWTRNYLMPCAGIMTLLVLGASYFNALSPKAAKLLHGALLASVLLNVTAAATLLNNNRVFHESETIFDDRKIFSYVAAHPEQFKGATIYAHRPGHMPSIDDAIPTFCTFTRMKDFEGNPFPPPFPQIAARLPPEARFVLFYWFANDARLRAFHDLPRAPKPADDDLKDFHHHRRSDRPVVGRTQRSGTARAPAHSIRNVGRRP